jgi:hypothetical protein
MRPNTLLILAGVIAFGTPAALTSQLATASAGSRVRVKAPTVQKRPIVGLLSAPIGDSVVITLAADSAGARRQSIPVTSIEILEVSMGRSSSAGARLGVKLGVFTSVILGTACLATEEEIQIFCPVIAVIYSLPLMAGGAVAGAVIGRERWRRLYPPSR